VFVSARDAAHARLPPAVSVSVICNGVDPVVFRPAAEGARGVPARVVFHGNMLYPPNEACVRFLAAEAGPRLEQEFGAEGFEIRLIGSHCQHLQAYAAGRPWITLRGYVEELGAELAAATVYAAPLVSGAGVKNKVLEAMACGLPVVGTPEAFSGLAVRPGTDVEQCPLGEIVPRIIALLRDPARRAALGQAARSWVLCHASWEEVARGFQNLLQGHTEAFPATVPERTR
jgi:glycosyltransferase involved in cell wall biosynthesis